MNEGKLDNILILPGWRILDVGGGHVPYSKATDIVDWYPEGEHNQVQRRGAGMNVPRGVAFHKADARNLPFDDNEFDFVVCAETLNHLDRPDAACSELCRVARAGYVEVPDIAHELFEPHDEHLWRCWMEEKTLVFSPKSPEDLLWKAEKLIGGVVEYGPAPYGPALLHSLHQCWDAYYCAFIWTDGFKWRVLPPRLAPPKAPALVKPPQKVADPKIAVVEQCG